MLSHPRVRHHRMRQHSSDMQILGIDLSPVGEMPLNKSRYGEYNERRQPFYSHICVGYDARLQ